VADRHLIGAFDVQHLRRLAAIEHAQARRRIEVRAGRVEAAAQDEGVSTRAPELERVDEVGRVHACGEADHVVLAVGGTAGADRCERRSQFGRVVHAEFVRGGRGREQRRHDDESGESRPTTRRFARASGLPFGEG